jgi:hypothetical protein
MLPAGQSPISIPHSFWARRVDSKFDKMPAATLVSRGPAMNEEQINVVVQRCLDSCPATPPRSSSFESYWHGRSALGLTMSQGWKSPKHPGLLTPKR